MKLKNMLTLSVKTVGIIFFSSLIATTIIIHNNSQQIQGLTTLRNGIETCFSRVNQSYVAKLLGQNSAIYLEGRFMQATEDCFAETLSVINNNFAKKLSSTTTKLNSLVSDVYWFHKKANLQPSKGLIGNTKGIIISNIGSRFEKLEIRKDNIIETFDLALDKHIETIDTWKFFFYSLVVLCPLFLIAEILISRRRYLAVKRAELEAMKYLDEEQGSSSTKAESILREALRAANLDNCEMLLNECQINSFLSNEDSLSASPATRSVSKESRPIVIPKEPIIAQPSTVNLEECFADVINHISSRLFSSGVALSVDIDENYHVYGNAEECEQIFYNLLTYCIEYLPANSETKNITIKIAKIEDDRLFLNICGDAGTTPQTPSSSDEEAVDSTPLLIAQELIKGLGNQITINRMSDDSAQLNIQTTFKLSPKNSATVTQLTSLKKGTKREIMKELERVHTRETSI